LFGSEEMEYINTLAFIIRGLFPAEWIKMYDDVLKMQNPQSRHFPLMNPFHVILIILAYLLLVFVGKAIMKNRPKMELKNFSRRCTTHF